MPPTTPNFLIAGRLSRDFILLPSGQALLDVPGGNALYAAVGAAIWKKDPAPALLARVGEDYPHEWLENFSQCGLNVEGVQILPQPIEVRQFIAILERNQRLTDDPVAQFARLRIPFPKTLLGYRKRQTGADSRTQMSDTSLRKSDIPDAFLDAGVAHLCPMDYLAHNLLPALLRQASFTTVTLDPSPGYMTPTFWDDIPSLLTGLTAFLPAEEEVRALFHNHSSDLRQIAEALASYGCEIVVIKCGERGQLLYDAAVRQHWEIPSYPSRMAIPLGAGDAFCGGFLVGYRRTYDALQATLYGNISASLVVEGHSALYALDALPGLAEARLEALRQSVRKI